MSTHIMHTAGLGEVSKALQALHQQLLGFQADAVRFSGSPLQLFDRATKDSAFAWLKPLREAIVAVDERRSDDEPITAAEAEALRDRVRGLLEAEAGAFRDGLNAAFQARPEAVVALGSARKSLNDLA
ncbi:MAG: hypothetical protein AAGA87_01585 [Pseudomonadota bacterium]